jgi:hypothetical protein
MAAGKVNACTPSACTCTSPARGSSAISQTMAHWPTGMTRQGNIEPNPRCICSRTSWLCNTCNNLHRYCAPRVPAFQITHTHHSLVVRQYYVLQAQQCSTQPMRKVKGARQTFCSESLRQEYLASIHTINQCQAKAMICFGSEYMFTTPERPSNLSWCCSIECQV